MECKIENCINPVHARGMCGPHYQKFRRKNKFGLIAGSVCVAENCNNEAYANGLCEAHRVQLSRTGVLKDIAYTRPYKMEPGLKCKAENCSKPARSKGLCQTHYIRMWGTGRLETKSLVSKGPWSDWARVMAPRANEEYRKATRDKWHRWAQAKVGMPLFHRRQSSPRTTKPKPSDWKTWSVTEQQKRSAAVCNRAKGTWEYWAMMKQKSIAKRGRTTQMTERVKSKQLRKLIESQGYKCGLTGRELEPETGSIDHVYPISRGGSNTLANLQVLHTDVNQAKGTMDPETFVEMCREVVEWVDKNGYQRGVES